MWIKTIGGDRLVNTSGKGICMASFKEKGREENHIVVGGESIYKNQFKAEAQEVLDYIWHRLEMNKNTCDLTRFKNAEAEKSAKWPGCEYEEKPKVHRNFNYDGIPEADK